MNNRAPYTNNSHLSCHRIIEKYAWKGLWRGYITYQSWKKKKSHVWNTTQIKSGSAPNDSCSSTGVKRSADNQEIQSQISSTVEFILKGLVFIILLFSNPIIVMFGWIECISSLISVWSHIFPVNDDFWLTLQILCPSILKNKSLD